MKKDIYVPAEIDIIDLFSCDIITASKNWSFDSDAETSDPDGWT